MEPDFIAHLATFPERVELLRSSLDRLRTIFPRIHICLNEFNAIPTFLTGDDGILPFIPDTDLKDVGKFVWKSAARRFDFLIDDDIVYPYDYADVMVAHAESLGAPVVLGVHGIVYRRWYSGGRTGRRVFHFESALGAFRDVDVLGTGTVMLPARAAPSAAYMAGSAGFVDVRFARYCANNGWPRICVPRNAKWLQQCRVEGMTLFDKVTRRTNAKILQEVNEIRRLRNRGS